MIACDECGHVNRLGAIYCGACGAKLEVDMQIIEQSVIATASSQRADKIFAAGRNLVVIGAFLFISGLVFRQLVVPPMPPFAFPESPAMTPDVLMNPEIEWIQPSLDHAPSLSLDEVLNQDPPSLLQWRRQHAEMALRGLDVQRITDWQLEIFNSRNPDGSWNGGDPVAATGLALLGLMAKPGPPAFEDAISKGLDIIQPLVLRGSTGRDPVAHTIGIMALIESGRLSDREIATLRPALYRGDAPEWQAIALLSFKPEQRPNRIAAIRSNLSASLWRHYLHFLSAQPVIETVDESLFAPGAGQSLETGIERVAWGCVSFWMGRNVEDLSTTLRTWTASDDIPSAPLALRQMAGAHSDWALAVMASCATIRAPISWVRPAPAE